MFFGNDDYPVSITEDKVAWTNRDASDIYFYIQGSQTFFYGPRGIDALGKDREPGSPDIFFVPAASIDDNTCQPAEFAGCRHDIA